MYATFTFEIPKRLGMNNNMGFQKSGVGGEDGRRFAFSGPATFTITKESSSALNGAPAWLVFGEALVFFEGDPEAV